MKKLETERLLLCPPTMADAEEFHYTIELDDQLFKYTPGLVRISKLEQTKNIIKSWINNNGSETHWIVKLKSTNDIIGMADISKDEDNYNSYEIGYAFANKYWKNGYGTEIAQKLVDYCFNELKCDMVCGKCDIDNIASRKVLENVGLKFKNEIFFKDRKWYYLSINKDEIKRHDSCRS